MAIVTPLPLAFDSDHFAELSFSPARGLSELYLAFHRRGFQENDFYTDNILALPSPPTGVVQEPEEPLHGVWMLRREWVAGGLNLKLEDRNTGQFILDIVGGYAILDDGRRVDF